MRLTVLCEDYDAATRTRTNEYRYELISDGKSTVEDREWIIHWYEPDQFRQLAAEAGLAVSYTEVDDGVEATLRHLG